MEIRTRRPLWGCQCWTFFAFFKDVCRFFFNPSICESLCGGWWRGSALVFRFIHTVCQCPSSLFSLRLVAVPWWPRGLPSHLWCKLLLLVFGSIKGCWFVVTCRMEGFSLASLMPLLLKGPTLQLFIVHCGLQWSHPKWYLVNNIAFDFLICYI